MVVLVVVVELVEVFVFVILVLISKYTGIVSTFQNPDSYRDNVTTKKSVFLIRVVNKIGAFGYDDKHTHIVVGRFVSFDKALF